MEEAKANLKSRNNYLRMVLRDQDDQEAITDKDRIEILADLCQT